MNYTNHSGGCPGADMTWETEGNQHGVKSISYSFYNHVQEGENQKMLTLAELVEGWEHVKFADKTLQRGSDAIVMPYMRNLLSRNWFQVKNAEKIYAVGKLVNNKIVDGGTGWTVQMALDNGKPVYLFEQSQNHWYYWNGWEFEQINNIPILTENFAGVGTRAMEQNGIDAIKDVYTCTFVDDLNRRAV